MIPLTRIEEYNVYSQDDAIFLLGEGFTPKAAREVICSACRLGHLVHVEWRRRYWFSGRAFIAWVATWFGDEGLRKLALKNGGGNNEIRRTGSVLEEEPE